MGKFSVYLNRHVFVMVSVELSLFIWQKCSLQASMCTPFPPSTGLIGTRFFKIPETFQCSQRKNKTKKYTTVKPSDDCKTERINVVSSICLVLNNIVGCSLYANIWVCNKCDQCNFEMVSDNTWVCQHNIKHNSCYVIISRSHVYNSIKKYTHILF